MREGVKMVAVATVAGVGGRVTSEKRKENKKLKKRFESKKIFN